MSSKNVVLVGGGGHAASLVNAFGAEKLCGYVAPEASEIPLAWLGDDDAFLAADNGSPVHIAFAAGRNGNMETRRDIIRQYGNREHATLIAETATVTPGSRIGEGCAVMLGAIVNGATLGRDCIVNTGAVIEHACRLGDNVFIGPNATLCGGVTVGSNCFIGAGATVINCVRICDGAVIGAGAVVTRDITSAGTYAGVPASRIK